MTWPIKTPDDIRREMAEREASWQGITVFEIRRKLRELDAHPFRMMLGRLLATGLRRYAPQHLSALPPEFLKDETDRGAA